MLKNDIMDEGGRQMIYLRHSIEFVNFQIRINITFNWDYDSLASRDLYITKTLRLKKRVTISCYYVWIIQNKKIKVSLTPRSHKPGVQLRLMRRLTHIKYYLYVYISYAPLFDNRNYSFEAGFHIQLLNFVLLINSMIS